MAGDQQNQNAPSKEKAKHHKKEEIVDITVNGKPVRILGQTATGHAIKVAAIEQGVAIHENFILHEELANGTSKVIGNHDQVHLHEHMKFTAIRHDDNS
jgi:hypothetical protein